VEEGIVTRLLSTGILTGGLAAAGLAGPAVAQPEALAPAQLDAVAAGSLAGLPGSFGFDHSTQISTVITMPSSTAIAVCNQCSDGASAVAQANALGAAEAGALAMTTGQGNTLATSTSVGPFAFSFGPSSQSAGSRGGAAKK
jgi:hypothetical protein